MVRSTPSLKMAKVSSYRAAPRPAIYLLKSVQAALRADLDEALAPLELTSSQMAVLSALSSRPQLSNAELARATFVKPQSMVPVLQSLEHNGWIVRRAAASGRTMPAVLTPKGRDQLKAGRAAASEVEARMLSGLSSEEALRLRELLEHCLQFLRPERAG
jgi:DNA-binding MarR family transcriptional regulator